MGFGSVEALKKYYQNFVEWDGSLNDGVKGPDLMFYFSNRDSNDFGDPQPFGLVDTCSNPKCKIQASSLSPTPPPIVMPTPAPTPKSEAPTPKPTAITPTPAPPTPSSAACSAHEGCKALSGDCCPSSTGGMLACCKPVEVVI